MNQSKAGTEERIVETAVQLFSLQGFRCTSTRQLARLAEVNEVSIFRYFAHKQELFWAALESRLERVQVRKELQQGLAQAGQPELVVPLIVELLVDAAVCHSELIQLLQVGFSELRPGTERLFRQHLLPILLEIREYLRGCMANGSLRRVDPSIMTIAFAATVVAHHGLDRLFADSHRPYANAEEAVRAYSDFWLTALLPGGVPGIPGPTLAVQELNPAGEASSRGATDWHRAEES